MVGLKFKKTGEGMFVSSKSLGRIFRRLLAISGVPTITADKKDIELWVSSGAPLGVESLCEWLVIDTDMSSNEIEGALSHNLPQWLGIVDTYDMNEDSGICQRAEASQFNLEFENLLDYTQEIENFLSKDEIIVNGENVKGQIIKYEFRQKSLILILKKTDKPVIVDLAESLIKALELKRSDFSLVLEEQYYFDETGQLQLVDKLIK